ncbi:MarR family transcriptional regulator [Mesorhizobium sp. CGMCC 1.15528]|uniref:MarR family transcriptional regulator n=1 Tax=Mesorhizobium zhangyense TaxID=1776730 RepID=A0A7C9R8F6_9HYPH|nr:MarR family transcriptional regulator [Mesorhizobium zhangyense]NGN40813.1 MarR family transcriptional regulator [Mesorhizobium zhangyense]
MKFSREKSAGYLTNWAARLFAKAIDRRLKELGLSSGQLPVFFALGDGGALSQKALTEIAAIEQPTMAATLSRMERDGLVARAPNPDDGRSALYSLTPKAMEKIPGVREAIAAVNAAALNGLGEKDAQAYLAMLRGVTANLEKELGE